MKNFIIISSITFITIFGNASNSKSNDVNDLVIVKSIDNINVSIDHRQELLSIVQFLGGYFRLNKYPFKYKEDIESYFTDFKNHEAVNYFKKLAGSGFTYDAPTAVMLYLNHNYKLDNKPTENLVIRAGGRDSLDEFVRLMQQFVIDSKFEQFFISHKKYYEKLVEDFIYGLKDFTEIKTLEEFYGKKQNSYNIILSILNSGNYGPSVTRNKKTDIYNIYSAKGIEKGLPTFGKTSDVLYLVWHEFGHSFVNYLTYDNIDLVNQYINLMEPIEIQMKNQAYGEWATVVNEHIIRAISVKLMELKGETTKASQMKYREISKGFIYIDPLCDQLENYIQKRDKYNTFESFYVELIKGAFTETLKMDYAHKYLQNLNNTYKSIDLFVISSNENNEKDYEEYMRYVKDIHQKFFKDKRIVLDKEAIKLDLSNFNIIVYGTIENNLVLQKLKDKFPVLISDTCIVADKEYITSTGKAIFNIRNPLNQDKYMVVYTAQEANGIVGINNVFHGPTNYVIFEDRNEVYKSGFLEFENNSWVCK